MKGLIIYYIVSTLVYFMIGTGYVYWSVFNMVSVLGSMLVVMTALYSGVLINNKTKEWLNYAGIVTFARIIYTTACAFAPISWIYYNNKIFATIFTLWMIIRIIRSGI